MTEYQEEALAEIRKCKKVGDKLDLWELYSRHNQADKAGRKALIALSKKGYLELPDPTIYHFIVTEKVYQ